MKNKPAHKKDGNDKDTVSLKGMTVLKNKSGRKKGESTSCSKSESDRACLICGESYINFVSGEGLIKYIGCLQGFMSSRHVQGWQKLKMISFAISAGTSLWQKKRDLTYFNELRV